jgi:hypothetical protein
VPYLNRWQAEYGAHGLQAAGIHTPELGIRYPVGQDNAFQTWRAWGNEAWPTFYLLDRDGRIVWLDRARRRFGPCACNCSPIRQIVPTDPGPG